MRRHQGIGLVLLLLAGLAFRLLCVSGPVHELAVHGPLYDDSFYAFGVARNIATGEGSTFDGEHLTSGYQPLWVGLLVPLYWLAPGDLPIHAALVLSALLNVATGWLLFRLLRRRVSMAVALLGVALWSFAPAIVRQAANGLETSLALFLVALALVQYLHRLRPRPTRRGAVVLGILLGLAILARVDALLFAAALGLDVLRRRRLWRAGLVTGLCVAALIGPWSVLSRAVLGTAVPESGEAMHLLSVAYAEQQSGGPAVPLWARNLGRSFLLLGTSPAMHGFTRATERSLDALGLGRSTQQGAVVLLLLAALVSLGVLLRRSRPRGEGLGFLWVYCLFLLLAYSCVVFGQIFFTRYYYPVFFVSILLGCLAFDALLRRIAARGRAVLWALAVAYVGLLPSMAWKRTRHRDYRFVNAVKWIDAQTPRQARVGVFNGGAIGYFSSRQVINLDGKVNQGALQALKQGRLPSYLQAEGIDYVIDLDWVLQRFLFSREDAASLQFRRVAGEAELGIPGWSAYRVTQARRGSQPPGQLSLEP